MTDRKPSSSDTDSRWSRLTDLSPPSISRPQLRATLFVALLVLSLPAMTFGPLNNGVAAAASNETSDDFEDGNADGWTTDGSVVSSSYNETYSLELGANEYATWDAGPVFNTSEKTVIESTYRIRIWTTGAEHADFGFGNITATAKATGSIGDGSSYYWILENTNTGNTSQTHSDLTYDGWYNKKLKVENGTAYFKVWGAGATEPDNWHASVDVGQTSGQLNLNQLEGSNDAPYRIDNIAAQVGSSKQITGRVTTESGDPVSNATVHVTGVNYDAISPGSLTYEQRANELLDQAENPLPANFDRSLDVRSQYLEGKSEEVPLAYTREDIATAPWTDQAELVPPNVVLPADEPIVFAPWNPDGNTGLLGNEYSNQMPGTPIDKGPVVVEQIGPDGSVVQTQKVAVDETVGGGLGDPSSMPYGETRLSPGIYRISLEGDDASYYISVGNPDQIAGAIEDDLRTEADQLSERAKEIRDRFANNKFTATTVETNESGYYTAEIGSNVNTVAVEAYRAPDIPIDPSSDTHPRAQIRNYVDTYNHSGSIYLPSADAVSGPDLERGRDAARGQLRPLWQQHETARAPREPREPTRKPEPATRKRPATAKRLAGDPREHLPDTQQRQSAQRGRPRARERTRRGRAHDRPRRGDRRRTPRARDSPRASTPRTARPCRNATD